MSDRWALVDGTTLIVQNVVIWGGGESLWPELMTINLVDREPCSPGWVYDPTPLASPRFTDPNPITQDAE
jgi:hypothetical protein